MGKHNNDWMPAFLEAISEGYSVTKSAHKAAVSVSTVYKRKREDRVFVAAWRDAFKSGTDCFADALRTRAIEGVEEPIVAEGQIIGYKRKYSDALLSKGLAARDPDTWGEKRQVDIGISVQGVLKDAIERANRVALDGPGGSLDHAGSVEHMARPVTAGAEILEPDATIVELLDDDLLGEP